jgi:hypothetical protein
LSVIGKYQAEDNSSPRLSGNPDSATIVPTNSLQCQSKDCFFSPFLLRRHRRADKDKKKPVVDKQITPTTPTSPCHHSRPTGQHGRPINRSLVLPSWAAVAAGAGWSGWWYLRRYYVAILDAKCVCCRSTAVYFIVGWAMQLTLKFEGHVLPTVVICCFRSFIITCSRSVSSNSETQIRNFLMPSVVHLRRKKMCFYLDVDAQDCQIIFGPKIIVAKSILSPCLVQDK